MCSSWKLMERLPTFKAINLTRSKIWKLQSLKWPKPCYYSNHRPLPSFKVSLGKYRRCRMRMLMVMKIATGKMQSKKSGRKTKQL